MAIYRKLASWFLLLSFLSSCGSDPGPSRSAFLAGEQTTKRLSLGWASSWTLVDEVAVPMAPGVFRAVAVPGPQGAELSCLAGAGTAHRWQLDQPTSIECPAGSASELILASDRPVELLQARWADPRRRGLRRLLIVADTLRFDHANAAHMPELDARFGESARFTRAYSAAAWTLPSVAALFTGRPPVELRAPKGTLISLPNALDTLAEGLAAKGQLPIAVVANPTVSYENGYAQGFGLFIAPDASTTLGAELTDATWVNRQALQAAEWFPDLDLFLYLQYMETHAPYRLHQTGEVVQARTTGSIPPLPAELSAMRDAYASEARYLSQQLDILLQHLGPLELMVFTADHGEELLDHGGFGHGPGLWDEVVRVPLWIQGTGIEAAEITSPVSQTQLKSFLVAGDRGLFDRPSRLVTNESFVHGPPRWAALQAGRRITWFAQRFEQPKAAAEDLPVHQDPVAEWLAQHHPRRLIETLPGIDPPSADDLRASLRALAGQFRGLRRGLFLFVAETDLAFTVSGVDLAATLIWGEPANYVAEPQVGGQLRFSISGPGAGTLLLLPARESQQIILIDSAVAALQQAPMTLPERGAIAWHDPGRPAAELQGIDETLDRLRALGYI